MKTAQNDNNTIYMNDISFRTVITLFIMFVQIGCINQPKNGHKYSQITMIGINNSRAINFKNSSIENIILSLQVEPDSSKYFESMVMLARESLEENKNSEIDELYIGGDGNRATHKFFLDRKDMKLTVIANHKNMIPPYILKYYLYYTPSGWLQSNELLSTEKIPKYSKNKSATNYWDGVGG